MNSYIFLIRLGDAQYTNILIRDLVKQLSVLIIKFFSEKKNFDSHDQCSAHVHNGKIIFYWNMCTLIWPVTTKHCVYI